MLLMRLLLLGGKNGILYLLAFIFFMPVNIAFSQPSTTLLDKSIDFTPVTKNLIEGITFYPGYKYIISFKMTGRVFSGDDSMSFLLRMDNKVILSMPVIQTKKTAWDGRTKSFIFYPDKEYHNVCLRQYCVGEGKGLLNICLTEEKNNINNGKKYIGAIVWDGQSRTNINLELCSNRGGIVERERISEDTYKQWAKRRLINTNNKKTSNWRKYCVLKKRLTKGVFLPTDCSFYEVFPKAAKKAGLNIENRQPIIDYNKVRLGWGCTGLVRDAVEKEKTDALVYDPMDNLIYEDNEQVRAQIDMATEYGIDFFAIYMEVYDFLFNEEGKLNLRELKKCNINNFLYQFIHARNKGKMKFCICVGGMKDHMLKRENIYSFFSYLDSCLTRDPSYLLLNGKPVVLLYDVNDVVESVIQKSNFSFSVYLNTVPSNKKEGMGLWSYAGFVPSNGNILNNIPRPYSDLSEYNYNFYQQSFASQNVNVMYTVSCGFDVRARYSYVQDEVNAHQLAFKKPTRSELYKALVDIGEMMDNRIEGDKALCIYAWNEFMEGGWLMPTQFEIESKDQERNGFYKLETVRAFKKSWGR